MKLFFFAIFFLMQHSALSQFKLEDFKNLQRLAALHGWEMKTRNGTVLEIWTQVNDSLFTGVNYRINGKDTSLQETIELRFAGGTISYTPTVRGQNNNQPVRFVLKEIDSSGLRFSFENLLHDFPQQIIYQLGGKSLHVTIRGETKEGMKEIPFRFVMK